MGSDTGKSILKEQKIEKFRLLEKKISFFTKYELVEDEQLAVENENLVKQIKDRDELLRKFSENAKSITKKIPEDDIKVIFEKLLKENNLI